MRVAEVAVSGAVDLGEVEVVRGGGVSEGVDDCKCSSRSVGTSHTGQRATETHAPAISARMPCSASSRGCKGDGEVSFIILKNRQRLKTHE